MRLLPSLALLCTLLGVSLGSAFSVSPSTTLAADGETSALYLPLALQGSPTVPNFTLSDQIGGFFDAVASHGDYAYLSNDARLVVLDISTPAEPREVSRSAVLPDSIDALEVNAQAVFAETADGQVYRIDVQNPASPVLSGPLNPSLIAHDIAVVDTHLYMTDKTGGLHIFALDAPGGPALVSSLPFETDGQPLTVHMVGSYAYVFQTGAMHLLDISAPADPVLRSTLALTNRYGALDVTEYEGYLYVASGLEGLSIIDVRDPDAPEERSSTFIANMFARMIGIAGSHVYIGGSDNINFGQTNRMAIFDISTPDVPIYQTQFLGQSNIRSLDTTGDKVLLALDQGMVLIDASDPNDLTEEGQYIRADTFRADFVQVQGRYAYLTGSGILYSIDTAASLSGGMEALAGVPTECRAQDLLVRGDYAYLTCEHNGLHILNIADPRAPVYLSKYTPGGRIREFDIAGDYAYLSSNEPALYILDISSPTVPVIAGAYDSIATPIQDVKVFGAYVLLTTGNTLAVIDVRDPAAPREAGAFALTYAAAQIETAGDYAFVSHEHEGFTIVDLSDPLRPREVATVAVPGRTGAILAAAPYLYVNSGHQYGLHVFDISQPTAPRMLRLVPFPGFPGGIAHGSSDLFLAAGQSGLVRLEVPTGTR
jgi:hypothetical protein